MRRIIGASLALAFLLAGAVHANNLLFIPTGITLTTGQVRGEAAISPNNSRGNYSWLGTGFQQFEFNVVHSSRPLSDDENLISAQWSFIPETFFTPGIAFGAQDVAAQSAEGPSAYAVVTKHLPIGIHSWFLKDFAVTAGIGVGGIRGPFGGVEAKLPWNFFVEGEYDSHDLNAAAGWQPLKMVRVKAYLLRSEVYYGAELLPITF